MAAARVHYPTSRPCFLFWYVLRILGEPAGRPVRFFSLCWPSARSRNSICPFNRRDSELRGFSIFPIITRRGPGNHNRRQWPVCIHHPRTLFFTEPVGFRSCRVVKMTPGVAADNNVRNNGWPETFARSSVRTRRANIFVYFTVRSKTSTIRARTFRVDQMVYRVITTRWKKLTTLSVDHRLRTPVVVKI